MNYRHAGLPDVAVLALTLAALLMAACARSEPGTAGTPAPRDTADAAPEFSAIPQPPGAVATAGSHTARLGVGSYCWPANDGRGPAVCVDRAGTVTASTPLAVARGAAVTVVHPLPGAPVAEIVARARPAFGAPERIGEAELLWPPGTGSVVLDSSHADDAIVFAAPAEPGAWVVDLFLRFGGGDVTYGLLLDVR